MKRILAFIFTAFIFLGSSVSSKADSILFYDNFDDGNLDGWTEIRSMQWSNQNSPCLFDGQKAEWAVVNQKIGIEINGPGCVSELLPDSFNLGEVKDFSFEFEMDFPASINQDRNYILLMKDLNNSYTVHLIGNNIHFQTLVNGQSYFIENSNAVFNFQPNKTYHFRNEFYQNGNIKIYVDDLLILNLNSNPLPIISGKIGLQASVGDNSYSKVLFDNVIVRSLDTQNPTTLQVPYFSQKDPIWANDEYDSVSQYSWATTPTMARYGCATTSMAMLLNFHGLTHLPNGALLTPQSLNNWLKTQPDGYIREGLISWNAVTRLTKKIADAQPGKTKLEYTYISGNDTDRAIAEIDAQQPVIFQVPGHFVVGLGHLDDTFQIHDPFWIERTSLDNAEYQNTFDSIRVFTPSQTDLSYITVATDTGFTTSLLDSNEQPVDFDSFVEGGLLDQVSQSGEQTVARITQLAKPESGEYVLALEGAVSQHYVIDVYLYDLNGEAEIFHLDGFQERPVEKFLITFDKNGGSFVEKITNMSEYDFADLVLFLEIMYAHGDIKNYRTYWQFVTLVLTAKYSPTNHVKNVLLGVIAKQFNNQKSKDVTDFAKEYFIPKVKAVQIKYQ